MAFRRRACYVCGQVGHLAENCSSNERLCFNCGKGGHESSACSAPRTADQKSCYHCLSKGHIKADCPNLSQRIVRDAPGVIGSPSSKGCFTCGGPHLARNCSEGSSRNSVRCRNCGGANHFARDCKAPASLSGSRTTKPKACYHCSATDHLARDCPQFPEPAAPQNVALVN